MSSCQTKSVPNYTQSPNEVTNMLFHVSKSVSMATSSTDREGSSRSDYWTSLASKQSFYSVFTFKPVRSEDSDLCEGEVLDFICYVPVGQLCVDFGQLVVVVEEPLDVRDDRAHHGLHGRTRPQALSHRLRFDALGKQTDAADIQERTSVLLVESRHRSSLSRHFLTWEAIV